MLLSPPLLVLVLLPLRLRCPVCGVYSAPAVVVAPAVKWYSKAADQGYVEAQRSLGLMFDQGQGV